MAEERKTPTEEIINQCLETLEDEKAAKRAEAKALRRSLELKENVIDYKICCLVKSREVWDLYVNLDLCYFVSSATVTTRLDQDINTYCTKEVELETKLKDAVKCIKEVKTKLNEVVDEACKLDRCIKEEKRCKKGLHELLKGSNNEWKALLDDIETLSVDCFNEACKTFDAGVDVVGIQTFVDLDSLKEMSADLKTKLTALRTDVNTNITKAETAWKTALTELIAAKEDLVNCEFDKCSAKNKKEGIESTIDFLCDDKACNIDDNVLDEICKKVKDNFGKDIEDNDDDNDQHDKKKPTRKEPKKGEDESWEME